MKPTNTWRDALMEYPNLFGMTAAASLAMALGSPAVALAAVVAETAYLLYVPDSPWYARRLLLRRDAQMAARIGRLHDQVVPGVAGEMRGRLSHLEVIRSGLKTLPGADADGPLRDILDRLDVVTERYLLFAREDAAFRRYVGCLSAELREGGDEAPVAEGERFRVIEERTNQEIAWLGLVATQLGSDSDREASVREQIARLTERLDYVGKKRSLHRCVEQEMRDIEELFAALPDRLNTEPHGETLPDVDAAVASADALSRSLAALAPAEARIMKASGSLAAK